MKKTQRCLNASYLTQTLNTDKETDLLSYVSTYLEQEIRTEANIRHMGDFTRFLEVAAGESGKQLNFTRLAQDIGISDTTIAGYFQILQDSLIVNRIDPITQSQTKRRLIKSPKFYFFDLGIRRACANEGKRLPQRILADLFEHYVGNELIHLSKLMHPAIKIKYWRDSAGPEVDFVIDITHQLIAIEVKWSTKPSLSDAKHLNKFLAEYPCKKAYIICQSPHRYAINEQIIVLPWQNIDQIFIEITS